MINNPITLCINNIADGINDMPNYDIPSLIEQLGDLEGFMRVHSRKMLIDIGKPAVPELINTLSNDISQIRWQVIKVLESLREASAIPALIERLKDNNAGVRWAASEALIALHQEAIPVLLKALKGDIESLWLRQGAHRILRVMKEAGRLNQMEVKVLSALEDSNPSITVPV